MAERKKEIKIRCEGAVEVLLDDLHEMQGELKTLSREDHERLRGEILKSGFSFPPHVWRDPEGKHWILDGHQRIKVVRRLVELEGYAKPAIPISFVIAESFEEARGKLLAAASAYGKVTNDGLVEYLRETEIGAEEMMARFRFAEIDMPKFAEAHFQMDGADEGDLSGVPAAATPEMRHASAQVRMVQLFFNDETHPEFLEKANALMGSFGKDNLTDTIMEALREAHRSRLPA